jgi:protein-S-isoprenylcysteine O-methyltransferase Ste14
MEISNILFQVTALLILASFYAIYIGKMILQKRKGIQTDQIAKGNKQKKLFKIEFVMKLATYSIVVVEIASIFLNTTFLFLWLRIVGAILGIIGVVIFGIAVYTMRDNWRAGIPEKDKTELVISGIFNISRNPAFLAFDLVYIGILLMFFNWILLIFTLWAMVTLHLQIKQEEKFLTATFGEKYNEYKNRTRRYMGKSQNRVGETGLFPVSTSHTTRHTVRYQGGSML